MFQNHKKFSLALSGKGRLMQRFEAMLTAQYPGITIYDRNAEQDQEWGPDSPLMPAHPEVADVDAVFEQSGHRDLITLRCYGHHRFFNCVSDSDVAREAELDRLLKQIVSTAEELLDRAVATAEAARTASFENDENSDSGPDRGENA